MRSRQKARENECERVTVSFGFTSDWMKSGANLLSQWCSVVIAKPITFRHSNENRSKDSSNFHFTFGEKLVLQYWTPRLAQKKLTPLSDPMRRTTQTSHDLLEQVFPRFASTTCIYFEFWLVHWIVCAWLARMITVLGFDTKIETCSIRKETLMQVSTIYYN